MPAENALAIVVRTSDWSETSRIATLYTREFGKVRTLAKGGRRLGSCFESALDLLTICRVGVIRKAAGLDILTEARVEERFAGLRGNLQALYGGYYIAELLGEGSELHDPHPILFDTAREALRQLNSPGKPLGEPVLRFELAWLDELGYRPRLNACAVCGSLVRIGPAEFSAFSAPAGGLVCSRCDATQRDRRPVSGSAVEILRQLSAGSEAVEMAPLVQAELRQVVGLFVSYVLGRRPRLLTYLE